MEEVEKKNKKTSDSKETNKKNNNNNKNVKNVKNVKLFKIVILILVLSILTGMVIYMLPVMKDLSTMEGKLAFKERISNSGPFGALILFLLQVAQIFLVILPGEPIEILAGMCYGSIWGTIYIMISACIISIGIFFLVRKLGKKLVYSFVDEEKVKKIERSKLFKNPKKIEFIMLILFLIPGTPKDLLVYVAGLLPIKPSRFILISTLARFPSVVSSTLAGENILKGNLKIGIISYAVILVIVAITVFVINKFDKDKTTEKVLKSIN